MKTLKVSLFLLMIGFVMNSCNKEESATTSTPYVIHMTDAPGPYDAVFIDLRGVEITGNDGKTVLMNVNTGIYNLLNFSNGKDTLIALGTLSAKSVQQIRLILGPNNSVVVKNVSYPLSTPSADQSGLKLQVHQTLQSGVLYSVLLDFDANQSVVETGSGTYKLKPVIKTIETPISGAIQGRVSPAGTSAFVTVSSGISFSTNVAADGRFMLMGLPAGTYSVVVTPASPLTPVIKNNVVVVRGVATDVGTINF